MKKSIFLFLLLSTLVAACNGIAQGKLNPDQFNSLLAKDKTVQLIDVRTPGEYASGHIVGSTNIDYNSPDFLDRMRTLDKNKPVAVYCAVGGRSGNAATKLKELGFSKVYDMAGGTQAWNAKQLPLIK